MLGKAIDGATVSVTVTSITPSEIRAILTAAVLALTLVAYAGDAQALSRPVVFVHGFCADRTTWDTYYSVERTRQPDLQRMNLYYDPAIGVREVIDRADRPPLAGQSPRFVGNSDFIFVADLSWSQLTGSFNQIVSSNETPVIAKARVLKAIIDQVKASTGSSQVMLVAHSMGGLVSRAYMQGLSGIAYEADVSALITIGTPNLGTLAAALWSTINDCAALPSVNKAK